MGRTQSLINDINETSRLGAEPVVNNKDKFKNAHRLRCAGDEE